MVAIVLAASTARVSAQTSVRAGLGSEPQSVRIKPENVRLNNYLHELSRPGALVGIFGGSLLDWVRKKDETDGNLWSGIGSRATDLVVQTSVRHGLAAVMHR